MNCNYYQGCYRQGSTAAGLLLLVLSLYYPLSIPAHAAPQPCDWRNHAEPDDGCLAQTAVQLAQTSTNDSTPPSIEVITPETFNADNNADSPAAEPPPVPDDSRQARARAIVDQFLAQISTGQVGPNVGHWVIDKDYTLEAVDDAYRAQFDEAAIVTDATRIDVGPIRLLINPQADALAQLDLRFGDTITVTEDGSPVFSINIGEQAMNGVWSETDRTFRNLSAQFKNFRGSAPDTDIGSFSLANLDLDQTLAIAADDSWQQAQRYSVNELMVTTAPDSELRVDNMTGDVSMNGRAFSELMAASQSMQQALEAQTDPEAAMPALFEQLNKLFGLFGDFEVNFTLNNAAMFSNGQRMGGVNQISLGSSLEEPTSPDGSPPTSGGRFDYRLQFDGIETPTLPLPPALKPSQARFEMRLDNLPPNMMMTLLDASLSADSLSEEEQAQVFQQQFLGLIMNSGLTVSLTDTYLAADASRVDLDATVQVNPQAMMGADGGITMRIEGMQNLIDASGAQQQQSIAPMLAMITAFSNRVEEDGKTIDLFDFRLSSEGRMLLNGKDVTAMFMPGAPPSPPAEPEQQ